MNPVPQAQAADAAVELDRLMVRFQANLDERAFERLMSVLLRPAVGVATRLLRDRPLAEDAVQEAFLRVVRNRDKYDRRQPFSAWFYGILRNICIDEIRRRQRQAQSLEDVAGGADAVLDTRKSTLADTRDLLALLPTDEQDVLELRTVYDMRFGDIASALGITEEAAKKRAQRGLHRLRQRLGEGHYTAGGRRPKLRSPTCPQTTPSHVMA